MVLNKIPCDCMVLETNLVGMDGVKLSWIFLNHIV